MNRIIVNINNFSHSETHLTYSNVCLRRLFCERSNKTANTLFINNITFLLKNFSIFFRKLTVIYSPVQMVSATLRTDPLIQFKLNMNTE